MLSSDFSSKNAKYIKWKDDWDAISDVKEGERTIKFQGTKYVPILGGQTPTDYVSYVERGVFYGATSRTISGLSGTILRKTPRIDIVGREDLLKPFFKSATIDGRSIYEVIEDVIENLLSYGRYGILVDMSDTELPYFSLYKAVDIYNWQTEVINGEKKLIALRLHETVDDSENNNTIDVIREYFLDEDGFVVVREYHDGTMPGDIETTWINKGEYFPSVKGKRLNYIPFVCIGSINNLIDDVNKPPILDLANLNLAHWRVTVDYYHGLHFCALPTIYAIGFDPKGTEFLVGPGHVIKNRNTEAKVGMLEFTGQGLRAVEKALESLENQMAVMGSRLLETQKKAAEAFETVKMRSMGDSATLSSVVDNAENGIAKAIEYAQNWMLMEGDVKVKLNKDFNPSQIDPLMVQALFQTYQGGGISLPTFLYNLKSGEVLPEDTTIEAEIERINEEVTKRNATQDIEKTNTNIENSNIDEIDTEKV